MVHQVLASYWNVGLSSVNGAYAVWDDEQSLPAPTVARLQTCICSLPSFDCQQLQHQPMETHLLAAYMFQSQVKMKNLPFEILIYVGRIFRTITCSTYISSLGSCSIVSIAAESMMGSPIVNIYVWKKVVITNLEEWNSGRARFEKMYVITSLPKNVMSK